MEFAKIFITLAALINPFGAIPAFIGLTEGQSRGDRRRTARTSALATFIVIAITAIAGQYLLAGFGITVPSLQVGGGVLMGGVVWLAFSLAEPISRLAGRTGLNIMTRLMGLVLAALAVEFIAAGIRAYVTA